LVVAEIDLPGAQEVAAPAIAPTVANLAAAIRDTLDGLGMDRLHVAGVAHGVRIAIRPGHRKDVYRTRPGRHLTEYVQPAGRRSTTQGRSRRAG